MIPKITIEPICENVVRVVLCTGIVIEISDRGESLGGDICVSESAEKLQLGRFKHVKITPRGADASGSFHVDMKSGVGL